MSWNKVKIGEVLNQYRIEHRVQNDITYKQVSILNDGSVVLRGEKIGKEIGRKRQFLIDLIKYPKTLIFTRQLLLQGSIGIAREEVHNCIVTENMPMFSVIETKIDVDYLIQFIKSKEFKNQVKKIELTGSAQKSIHEKTFLQLEIPLPSLNEQKSIVNTIKKRNSRVDAISTELTHQLSLVKKLRQQLLQDAVQGKLVPQNPNDEPASELLKKIKAEKQKLFAEGNLKKEKELPPIKADEIPFEIPENWVWCRLGEITTLITDGEHLTPPRISTGRKLLSAKNIRDGFIEFENVDYISEETYQKSIKRCNPQKGDVLIVSVGGTIGRSSILEGNEEFAIVRSVALIKPESSINNRYIKLLLDSPLLQKDIQTRAWGTAQPCLYINQIKELSVSLPPISEQNRIVKKLDELMQTCDALEASIKESVAQNEKLLQQVLREALRKPDITEPLKGEQETITAAAEPNLKYGN